MKRINEDFIPAFTAEPRNIAFTLTVVFILLILAIAGCVNVGQPAVKNEKAQVKIDDSKRIKSPTVDTLDALLREVDKCASLPDEEIDVPYVSLLCTRFFYPETNIQYFTTVLDGDAAAVKPSFEAGKTMKARIEALRYFIMSKKGISFVPDSVYGTDPDWADKHRWIPQLLQTKKGSCISMVLYYIALLDRLGVHAYPVVLPSHVFLRVKDGESWINVETTTGNATDSSFYETNWKMKEDRYYLVPLSGKQFVGMLLSNHVGFCLNNQKRYVEALACLEKALVYFPGFPDALGNKGIALRRLGKPDEAILLYKSVLHDYPESRDFWINIANAYGDKGDKENQLHAFTRVVEIKQRGYELVSYKGMMLQARSNRAYIFVNSNRNEEAIAECDRLDELMPRNPWTIVLRATAMGNIGRHKEAIALFRSVNEQEVDPSARPAMYFNMGNSYHSLGELADALACYDRSIALNPGYENPLRVKGIVLMKLGRLAEAYDSVSRAMAINPKNPANRLLHIRLRYMLGDVETSLEDINAYVSEFPKDETALATRALILSDRREYAEAIADMDRAILYSPGNGDFFHTRGLLKSRAGDLGGALDDFKQARAMDPETDVVSSFESLLLAKRGKYEDALAMAEKAISSGSDNGYWTVAAKCLVAMHEKRYGDVLRLSDEYTWNSPSDDFARKELVLTRLDALKASLAGTVPVNTSVDTIMESHITAIGGRLLLGKVKTLKSKAILYQSDTGNVLDEERWSKAPDSYISIARDKYDTIRKTCFNGKSGWEYCSLFGYRNIEGAELDELRRECAIDEELRWKELYSKTELCGIMNMDGRPAYVIIRIPFTGIPSVVYIDTKTFLIAGEEDTSDYKGKLITTVLLHREYATVEGIELPVKQKIRTASGELEVTCTENRINPTVDDAIFEKTGK